MKQVFKIKNKFKQDSKNIIEKKDEADENDLKLIKKIILRDNTEPNFILAYLEMVRRFNNEEFMKEIKKYQYFLTKEEIFNNFGKFYKKEISVSDLFFNICEKIMKFNNSYSSKEKILFYLELTNIETNYNIIKGIADYENSKELTLYILVHNIQQGIIKHINHCTY